MPDATPPTLIRLAAGESAPSGRKLAIVAYTGQVCRPMGYGDSVFVLGGIDLPATVPLLADHDNSLAGVVGQGTPKLSVGQLLVAGELATGGAADRAAGLLADGVKLQASVGLQPVGPLRFVQPGEKVAVNGRDITAGVYGLTVVDRSRLMEVSLVPVGADPSTSVSITAKGSGMLTPTDPTATVTPATPPPADPVQAERERVAAVLRATADYPAVQARAVSEGWTLARANEVMLAHLRDSRPKLSGGGSGAGSELSARHLSAAILCRAGQSAAAEAAYGPEVMHQLGRLRTAAMPDLCAAALGIDRRDVPHARAEMIRAAVSTGSMPTALGDAARVSLEQAYRVQPATWRAWCAVRPAQDFKKHRTLRPNFLGDLEKVGPGGEIKSQSFTATDAVSWQVDTFGRLLTIDRRDIINDDLSAFAEVIPSMGRTAARGLGDLVYKTVLANPGAFFDPSNGNLLTGAGSALGVPGMAAAVKSMRTHRDADGNDLDILPAVLVVPPDLETAARQLLNSEQLWRDGTSDMQPTANPFSKAVALAVEPRLSNTKFPGASAAAWYLFGGPEAVPGVVGFLDGMESPNVQTFGLDSEPETLAMSWRVFHDYGFSLGDRVATVKSAGA